eukprot:scaffold69549_cov48-Prasinocladus_malaysianus.AAC.1
MNATAADGADQNKPEYEYKYEGVIKETEHVPCLEDYSAGCGGLGMTSWPSLDCKQRRGPLIKSANKFLGRRRLELACDDIRDSTNKCPFLIALKFIIGPRRRSGVSKYPRVALRRSAREDTDKLIRHISSLCCRKSTQLLAMRHIPVVE